MLVHGARSLPRLHVRADGREFALEMLIRAAEEKLGRRSSQSRHTRRRAGSPLQPFTTCVGGDSWIAGRFASSTGATRSVQSPHLARRVLITGIGGQDGSLLCEFLLSKGYRVAGIVRRDPSAYGAEFGRVLDQIELVKADLLDQDSLVQALELTQPDEVYNLASPSFVPRSWDQPVLTAHFSAVGVTSLLEAVRAVDSRIRVYQASSSEIFGEPFEVPQTEDTALSPVTPYGVAKAYGHFIVKSYRRRYGLFACCGILYNHESPRRPLDFLPRKVAHAAAAISLGLSETVTLGDLGARRDWGYAPDYVRAMWLMLQQDAPSDYVIASGESHSVHRTWLRSPSPTSDSTGSCTFVLIRLLIAVRPNSTTSSGTHPRRATFSVGHRRCPSTRSSPLSSMRSSGAYPVPRRDFGCSLDWTRSSSGSPGHGQRVRPSTLRRTLRFLRWWSTSSA